MIDFEQVWLPQIVSYAVIITDGTLEAQWLGRRPIASSISDPDELYTQIFEDLDADDIWANNRNRLGASTRFSAAVAQFLSCLRDIDGDAPSVLASDTWLAVKAAAADVLAHVHQRPIADVALS